MELSPQMKNQLNQLEQIRQQLQLMGAQKSQLESQDREADLALKGLEGLPEDATVYKTAGSLLVRSDDRKALRVELEEEKETISVRVKTLNRQEEKLKERFTELQDSLQKALGGGGTADS